MYLIGKWSTFTDASGNLVRHFQRERGLNRATYYKDLTAKTKGAATRLVNMAQKRLDKRNGRIDRSAENIVFAITAEQYRAQFDHYNPVCFTRNMLNPKAGLIEIRASDFGGCCDPGTERYHAM